MNNKCDIAISLSNGQVSCECCEAYRLCRLVERNDAERALLGKIKIQRRPIKRGKHLFRLGAAFHSIVVIRSGSAKTYVQTERGRKQVTGFYLPGELFGLSAIHSGVYTCEANTLETTAVCEISFGSFKKLADRLPELYRQLLGIMSGEILRRERFLIPLGEKNAEARLTSFLLDLSQRFRRRGFSGTKFPLSMSRCDIGSYLGLSAETVCRLLARFQQQGVLSIQRKHVALFNLATLGAMTGLLHASAG